MPKPLMDLTEFRDAGYLQEVNRRFFHPLGLALAVDVEDDGSVSAIAGLLDSRDDPEGYRFAESGGGSIDPAKTESINNLLDERMPARKEALGYLIQPVPN